jgi:hypothetical protein
MSWWVEEGINYLEGNPNDPSNPVKIPDLMILEFLSIIPEARSEFESLYPSLSDGAKSRLTNLLDSNPFIKRGLFIDPKDREDNFQKSLNSGPIWTCGPKGGTGFGG